MAAIILSLLAAALLSTVLLIPAGHLKQALGIPSAVCSAAAMGLYGVITGMVLLIWYTAGLESFGVPYLAPFTSAAGQERGSPDLIRLPLPWMKWRPCAARSANRRNQR